MNMSNVELLTQEKIDQIKQDAWLGIYVNEKTLYNPLENIPDQYHENPHLFFTYLMSRPEYFQFICKEILNMEIFPFQSVILREMWTHKFPLLVASRGASKCVTYNTKILTREGIKNIGDVIGKSSVGERVYFDNLETYTEKGWKKVEYGWNNGETETVIIELENGMSIEATLNHPLRVKAGSRRKWKDAGDITLDDELILQAPSGWFKRKKYSNEYINLLVQLDNLKNEVPESIFCMSKANILNYIDQLVNRQRVYKTLFKSKARDLQLLYFYASGCNAIITKEEEGYSVRFKRDKIKSCKIKSITKSRNVTYDIHLYENHSFLSNGMVSHNSFTLALYALLRAILLPGRKVIIVGSVFRQSKVIFNYLTKMYNGSPLLMDANNHKNPKMYPDRCELEIGDSLITALPVGTGESIRGYRSNDTIADEFAAQSQEVFETVIAGFGSVSQSPIANAKEKAAIQFLKAINKPVDNSIVDDFNKDNQIILTGSAYYYFNHFAQYWERWRSIINTKGNQDKLYDVFKGDIPEGFNWEDYSVLRLPVELLPPGFMDSAQIARSKATMTSSIFLMEYNAVFSKDSDGFFKASSIENATANIDNNITFPSSKESVIFDPKVRGEPNKRYVMGVDPASEVDNFSIVIIELNPDHNRIVYCWTTNSKKFKKKLQKGLIQNKDYYGFCARKIRDLMKDFNIVHIAIDAQGGGKAVYEAFQDDKNNQEGELALLEIIESDKKKDSDGMVGLHIIEMVQFSNYDYISSANHNLKKDIEDKVLLFPRYSVANLAIQSLDIQDEDLEDTSIYDTLEDCIIEIQELKFELAQIVVTVTPSGRERWDTPEVKISGNKKGRARKDRYSSLLISNAAARKLFRGDIETTMYNKIEDSQTNNGFIGPVWATKALEDLYS